ncbi:ApeI family dehydratase [Methylomagnum sp.]
MSDNGLLPDILGERKDGDGIILDLRIPGSLKYFDGHFPGTPVVPGVVQIHWAVALARPRLKPAPSFHHMEVVKFKDLILPRRELQLHLDYHRPSGRLRFAYRTEEIQYSSGRIYFHGD